MSQYMLMFIDDGFDAQSKETRDKAMGGILDKMFAQIDDPSKFDASRFAADVKEFQKKFK